MSLVDSLIWALALGSSVWAQNEGATPPSSGLDPGWLHTWQQQVDEQVTMLSRAYSLDATMEQAVRQELEQRIYQQQAWEKKNDADLDELIKKAEAAGNVEGSQEVEAMWAKIAEYEKMPLSEEPVEEWLQKQLPPQVVAQGHVRWVELRERREAIKEADEEDSTKGSQISTEMGQTRLNAEAVVTPDSGQPLPTGEKGQMLYAEAQAREAYQSRPQPYQVPRPPALSGKGSARDKSSPNYDPKLDLEADPSAARPPAHPGDRIIAPPGQVPPAGASQKTGALPTAAPTAAAPPVEFQKAPPLDDWDKFVISFAEKYHFSEAQVTNARSILKALKVRANQYRMSRSDAFAQAELTVDSKARAERLKQLNRPLDALFDELKQRLESLPTQEQKHQANAPAVKPAGKK